MLLRESKERKVNQYAFENILGSARDGVKKVRRPLRWLVGPTPALDGLTLTSRSAPAALRPASPCLATVRGRCAVLAAPHRASRPARTARTALVGPRAAVCVAPAGRRAQSGCSNFWFVANKRLAMLTFAFFVDSREAFLRAASLVHAKWRQAAKRIVVANEPATKMPSSRAVRRISGSHGWRSLHGSLPEKHFRAIRLSCPRWSSRPPDVSSRTRGPSAWHSARATGRLPVRLATGALRILTTAWIRDTVRRAGEITRRPGGRCSEHTFQRRCPFDGSASRSWPRVLRDRALATAVAALPWWHPC